jgi:hypothetical protein
MGCPTVSTTGPSRRRPLICTARHCLVQTFINRTRDDQRVQGMIYRVPPTRSTPRRSSESINGIRAVLGYRSCLGKKRNNKSILNRQRQNHLLSPNSNPRSERERANGSEDLPVGPTSPSLEPPPVSS